jgi:hypothetical protein
MIYQSIYWQGMHYTSFFYLQFHSFGAHGMHTSYFHALNLHFLHFCIAVSTTRRALQSIAHHNEGTPHLYLHLNLHLHLHKYYWSYFHTAETEHYSTITYLMMVIISRSALHHTIHPWWYNEESINVVAIVSESEIVALYFTWWFVRPYYFIPSS